MAEEGRKVKATEGRSANKKMSANFQRESRNDKNEYLQGTCKEMEAHSNTKNTAEMFRKIKEISGTFSSRTGSLKDENGEILTGREEIQNRWTKYTEKLYLRDTSIVDDFRENDFEDEAQISESEVIEALESIADYESPGSDDIPIELIKKGGEETVTAITRLCQRILITKKWPTEWKSSVCVPLPKKGDLGECGKYRTIALISCGSNLLLKIIQRRIENILETEMLEEQAGFRKDKGCRDQISNFRRTLEACKEYQQTATICFIDYRKALYCVDHNLLWKTLREMGISENLIVVLRNLYRQQRAAVRTERGNSDSFTVDKGVRQGCILSPYLFNLYSERIMR